MVLNVYATKINKISDLNVHIDQKDKSFVQKDAELFGKAFELSWDGI